MDDSPRRIEFYPDHFEASTPTGESPPETSTPPSLPRTDCSSRSQRRFWARRKFMSAASMLNLFSLPGLHWKSDSDGQEKVELSVVELQSLRSEIADLEEREALLKARLEHLDEILRSARLSGYLFIRTRWTALPGEPPIDESDVDDWLPRFVVLQGPCIFFYLQSTDMSPLDSTLLSDVVEVGPLPVFMQEDEQRYSFFVLTRQGLRYECSSPSKMQVDSWMRALRIDCTPEYGTAGSKDSMES
ncbi:hypothetical protein Scep_006026 [Stephania cephalantha]|uniref:PH domain-containing protein n=1 Tax=Stephania cephalantha TaxID=152367 RepID=A0AAP0K8T4_9MAGN